MDIDELTIDQKAEGIDKKIYEDIENTIKHFEVMGTTVKDRERLVQWIRTDWFHLSTPQLRSVSVIA